MALPVLDGNQTATTLSSVVTGGEHIVAHSVVSLGANAIANITSAVSGSVVSISNFPPTQTVAGTVTANLSSTNLNSVTIGVRGTVTVGNSVTIGSLPAISGTVTIGNSVTVTGIPISPYGGINAQIINDEGQGIGIDVPFYVSSYNNNPLPISGSVTASNIVTVTMGTLVNNSTKYATAFVGYDAVNATWHPIPLSDEESYARGVIVGNSSGVFRPSNPLSVAGTVTVGNSVTISSLPAISGTVTVGNAVAISGTVTANPTGTQTIAGTVTVSAISTSVTARLVDSTGTAVSYAATGSAGTPSTDVISVQGVSGGTSLPISGTAGTLTTRFGSVTTANTAQISSAVTNTSRKYLLIQNVTTSSNVITIGVGFTPTTTQGIQLTAGAGITFESSYIPTGAVYVLSSVTASPFTILEA